jgi:hypothetical protein
MIQASRAESSQSQHQCAQQTTPPTPLLDTAVRIMRDTDGCATTVIERVCEMVCTMATASPVFRGDMHITLRDELANAEQVLMERRTRSEALRKEVFQLFQSRWQNAALEYMESANKPALSTRVGVRGVGGGVGVGWGVCGGGGGGEGAGAAPRTVFDTTRAPAPPRGCHTQGGALTYAGSVGRSAEAQVCVRGGGAGGEGGEGGGGGSGLCG